MCGKEKWRRLDKNEAMQEGARTGACRQQKPKQTKGERGVFFWWEGLEGKTSWFRSVGQQCLLFESMPFKKQASQVALVVKNPTANAGRHKRAEFEPCIRKIPWRREWLPTSVSLPGESHGQRSLVGYSP